MKIKTTVLTFLLIAGFLPALLQAQPTPPAKCGGGEVPAIKIGEVCVQPGGEVDVPIYAFNFFDIIYYQATICLPPTAFFSVVSTTSHVGNQTVNFNPFTNRLTLNWGQVALCPAPSVSFINGLHIATVRIAASDFAPEPSCQNFTACHFQTAPSVVGRCKDGWNIEMPITICPGSACTAGDPIDISGTVRNRNGQGVGGIVVSNSVNGAFDITDQNGNYTISNVPTAGQSSIVITPSGPPIATLQGITLQDVVTIRDHLLNNTPLDCFQMIAADANFSNTVTTFDDFLIENSILGPNILGQVGTWRFLPADFVFPPCVPFNPAVPTGFPTSITIDAICQDVSGVDFTGLKVGDVTFDAVLKAPVADVLHSSVSLMQNPFSEQAAFRFQFAETTSMPLQAELSIYDLSGKRLHAEFLTLNGTDTQLQLDARQWPTGLLMYQVTTATERFSGRMLHQTR